MSAPPPPHPPARDAQRQRLTWALGLAVVILGIEIAGGLLTNSLALLADAAHVFGDASALSLALGAIWLAGRPAGTRRTFGWHRVEILAASVNGAGLFVIAGVIVWQAIDRIGDDPEIAGVGLLAVAAVGLAANLAALRILHGGDRKHLNVRGAYLHVLGDTAGSVGALVAGGVIALTDWTPIDVIISLGIAALIVFSGARLLRDATDVLLEAAPPGIDVNAVTAEINTVPGVLGVHDLHLWTVTSGFPALSCHVEVESVADAEPMLLHVTARLQERFGLTHVTLQPETAALHAQMACCEFPDQPADGRVPAVHRSDAETDG